MKVGLIILSTLVIFIAGLVTGALLITFSNGQLLADRPHLRPEPPVVINAHTNVPAINPKVINPKAVEPSLNPWQERMKELLRRMDRELDLTSDQHQHIETLIRTSQERTSDLWRPIAPQMNKESQWLRAEIRDQLDPDQREKFDQLIKPRVMQEKRRAAMNGNTNSPVKNLATNSLATNAVPDSSVPADSTNKAD